MKEEQTVGERLAGEWEDEQKQRHKEWYKSLDELVYAFVMDTRKTPTRATIHELMRWSYEQTLK